MKGYRTYAGIAILLLGALVAAFSNALAIAFGVSYTVFHVVQGVLISGGAALAVYGRRKVGR